MSKRNFMVQGLRKLLKVKLKLFKENTWSRIKEVIEGLANIFKEKLHGQGLRKLLRVLL